MEKMRYNKVDQITDFKNRALPHFSVKIGFIARNDFKIEVISDDANVGLASMQGFVGGYIEKLNFIQDSNFDVIVDEEGFIKKKKFNLLAYMIIGYELYGDVLFLRKGILK